MDRISRRTALRVLGAATAGAATVLGVHLPAGARARRLSGLADVPDGELTGRVVLPADATYEMDRLGWDALFQSYPSVIVFVQDADDVVNALRYARSHDTALRARSGRHSLEGWSSVDGGVVIDVSELKDIRVDRASKTARVGTGVTQGEIVAALAGTGLGFPTGNEATIGLGGVVLGGGIGLLGRAMGVACDNLLEVEIVVPSGDDGARVVTANGQQNADLLWACRGGGGGNFGIATSYTLRLHPLPDPVTPFQVNWTFEQLHQAFDAWQQWAPVADTRLGSTIVVLPPSSGIQVDGVFLGSQSKLGDLLAPITDVAGAQTKTAEMSWPDYFKSINTGVPEDAFWKFTPSWAYRELSSDALDTVGEFLGRAPADQCNYWSLSWGGRTKRPPAGGSAFFHRDPLFYSEPGAGWNDASLTEACMTWVGEFREALLDHVEGGYVNVPDRAIADFGASYYGTNFDRLRRVKAKWDPDEVFRFEQSIPPA